MGQGPFIECAWMRRSHDHGIPWEARGWHWEALVSHGRCLAVQVP